MSDSSETIKAINPKYQTTISRFVKWDATYNEIVSITENGNGPEQQRAYERAAYYFGILPKRERTNIARHMDVTGY